MQKEHTFTVDGLISGWAYIQNNIISPLKMDGLISGGLKTGGEEGA